MFACIGCQGAADDARSQHDGAGAVPSRVITPFWVRLQLSCSSKRVYYVCSLTILGGKMSLLHSVAPFAGCLGEVQQMMQNPQAMAQLQQMSLGLETDGSEPCRALPPCLAGANKDGRYGPLVKARHNSINSLSSALKSPGVTSSKGAIAFVPV